MMGCPFLANLNLPLGSAQAAAAGTSGWNPPVSDQNAYSGGTNSGPSTEVSGAGLNPAAIVGVRLDGADYNTATWDLANPKYAGAQHPVLTGMAPLSVLQQGDTVLLISGEGNGDTNTLDSEFVSIGNGLVTLAQQYLSGAGPNDYVPFQISTLSMGRGLRRR